MLKKIKAGVVQDAARYRTTLRDAEHEAARAGLEELALRVETTLDIYFSSATAAILLDFPEHENVGDSAIWLGARAYLQSRHVPVVHMSSGRLYNPSRVRRHLDQGTVVVLSGGGNLGDLYPNFQRHRERVIGDLTGAKIVQLPQTVHFEEDGAMKRSLERLASHPDLVVLARDSRSYELLNVANVKTHLCPDLSHLLFPLIRASPGSGTVVIARTDKERADPQAPYEKGWHDWPEAPRDATAFLRKATAGASKLPGLPQSVQNSLWTMVWPRLARGRVERARHILERFENVATDRLHGLLLAVLLHRRVVAVDNSYGKVFAYLNTWEELNHIVKRELTIADASRVLAGGSPVTGS